MTMFKKVAKALADNGVLQEKDIDICAYGLEVMFSTLIEFSSIFIISAFVGNFVETLLFFAAFVPLRIYAGGYHADTKFKCYIISLGVYGIFTVLMKLLSAKYFMVASIISVVFTVLTVIVFAPIIHVNRNVNEKEKAVYRKFSVMISLIEALVFIVVLFVIKQSYVALSFALGQAAVAISMIAAILKERVKKKTANL